jgi:hypothetical protein
MKESVLNHVALLGPSVQRAAGHLEIFKVSIGSAEKWDGVGKIIEIEHFDLSGEAEKLKEWFLAMGVKR